MAHAAIILVAQPAYVAGVRGVIQAVERRWMREFFKSLQQHD